MKEKELQSELASIRSIMERSSKFISLSGLSGILAGIYALIGAGVAYKILSGAASTYSESLQDQGITTEPSLTHISYYYPEGKLLTIALLVLIASITTALILSTRQAKRKGVPMWGSVSRSLLFHMAVPLIAGGALILIFILHHHYGFISAASLIFYGIALVSASNFTFADVKYLGLLEIALGLVAACLPGNGLLFWAIGFGALHIIYGARIYLKYDK